MLDYVQTMCWAEHIFIHLQHPGQGCGESGAKEAWMSGRNTLWMETSPSLSAMLRHLHTFTFLQNLECSCFVGSGMKQENQGRHGNNMQTSTQTAIRA